ncbi:hypothetical protein [Spirosoma rigui]|uniref:hypothetical protein n=1 Tax=Spirosoma rigui TaxID=564064 RepID=UPI0009AFD096|nr:hypothetical protein [Spirosoma rigui]
MQNLLNPDEVTPGQLADRVKNYFDYASTNGAGNTFLGAIITKDVLRELLDSDERVDGIRIYLAKDTPHSDQTDVRMLAVPVALMGDEQYVDILDNTGKVHLTACRDPYCPKSFIPGQQNLLPDSYK